ncbi:MAG: hypothetical protein M3355_02445 [Actinomycetota bacterium]|nr:hypothetical protein [Actinomycetota bacterium]
MTDEPSASKGSGSPEGVFGNLPSTRPGSRSPRRRGASGREAVEAAAEDPEAPGEPEFAPEPPAAPEPEPAQEPQTPAPGIHGVEDLAWAGVAVAAQAATAGVRFASRALEAARKSIDRP